MEREIVGDYHWVKHLCAGMKCWAWMLPITVSQKTQTPTIVGVAEMKYSTEGCWELIVSAQRQHRECDTSIDERQLDDCVADLNVCE
jgi:hypothetical protein